jgi:dCTP deaminase
MSKTGASGELFPKPTVTSSNIIEMQPRNTGILPYQGLRAMIEAGEIASLPPIEPNQIQPASLDLRLGRRAYRVRASFLPGPNSTVMERIKELDGLPPIDLAEPAVFEKGAVYVVELLENVRLTNGLVGAANPKSSTGRLDVLTRLITDKGTAFDRIDRGYKGPLYVEVAPLTFPVVVRQGSRLNQIRFQRGGADLAASEIQRYYAADQLTSVEEGRLALRDGLVPVSVDLRGRGDGGIVGYKAKKNTNKIDVDLVNYYDPRDFWDKIEPVGGRLNLDKDDFHILGTREDVGVPPTLAAEMIPYDTSSGEFRVHYAGFFDPGFGWDGQAGGTRAVLEVRSYGVSFTLEHGQIVGWLNYSWIATGRPDKIYGQEIKSNYQGQGVALSKHFKPFPV